MRRFLPVLLAAALLDATSVRGDDKPAKPAWPTIDRVEAQPLLGQVKRLRQALDNLGSPIPKAGAAALSKLKADDDDKAVTAAVQKVLDPLSVAAVEIAKDGKLTVTPAAGKPALLEQGWRAHLVKVINRAGST